jgi:hypothetical protein
MLYPDDRHSFYIIKKRMRMKNQYKIVAMMINLIFNSLFSMEESGNKSLENLKTCRYWPLLSFQNIKSGMSGIRQDAFTKVNKECGRLPLVCVVNALLPELVGLIFHKMLDEKQVAIEKCQKMPIIYLFEMKKEIEKRFPFYIVPKDQLFVDFISLPENIQDLVSIVQPKVHKTPLITYEDYEKINQLDENVIAAFAKGTKVNVVKKEFLYPKVKGFFTKKHLISISLACCYLYCVEGIPLIDLCGGFVIIGLCIEVSKRLAQIGIRQTAPLFSKSETL